MKAVREYVSQIIECGNVVELQVSGCDLVVCLVVVHVNVLHPVVTDIVVCICNEELIVSEEGDGDKFVFEVLS